VAGPYGTAGGLKREVTSDNADAHTKKSFDYVVGALGFVAGSLIIYSGVRAILVSAPEQNTRRLKWILLVVVVPAVILACVKLWRKYKGEQTDKEEA